MVSIRDEIQTNHTHVNTFEPGQWPGRQRCPVRALVFHVMDGGLSGSVSWAHNPASEASFNYGIGKDGTIIEVVDPDSQAPWANGIQNPADTALPSHLADLLTGAINANWVTLSIELAGKPAETDFPTERQYQQAIRLGAELCRRYGLTPSAETLLPHRAFSTKERPHCPGPRFDFGRVIGGIQAELGELVMASSGPLSGDSPLLALPSAPAERAKEYIIGRGSVYAKFDVGVIVDHYWRLATEVGLDPVLAMAQCILETSGQQPNGQWWPLSSWWAQRPRRNPAGLGVTGERQTEAPANPAGWVFDEPSGEWRRGLTFESWELAAQAHIGRLLAYALTDEQANPAQRDLIARALALRPLPANFRGVAPTLVGLNGRWAVPGTTYGQHIARIANEICSAGGRGIQELETVPAPTRRRTRRSRTTVDPTTPPVAAVPPPAASASGGPASASGTGAQPSPAKKPRRRPTPRAK